MVSTSDWIAIASLALNPISAIVGYRMRMREEWRKGMPIVRWDGDRIEVVNRLNEDLIIEEIDTVGRLAVDGGGAYDDYGDWIPGGKMIDPPYSPGWTIEPSARTWRNLRVFGSTSARITVSSSNSTLRRRRVTITCSETE